MKVYFLPYVAAMWRSMKPLYDMHVKAGDETVLMPIPYYGRNPAMELAYPKYEGDRFPGPVVNYKDIDLAAEHPDRIYIHNPYDAENRVTSIDPAYYSDKLKEYTKELAYVPYYTIGYGEYDLCGQLPPAAQNADIICTWSRAQFEHAKGNPRLNGKEIVYHKRPALDPGEIPEEWQKKTQYTRVVMLGTSLGALMRDPVNELRKIDNTIRGALNFNRYCLLWRPHPLYLDTIRALFPKYEPAYMKTVRWFLERGSGIYDDTWDLERAVCLSDEYIGDPSSVTMLFKAQNKPVRII